MKQSTATKGRKTAPANTKTQHKTGSRQSDSQDKRMGTSTPKTDRNGMRGNASSSSKSSSQSEAGRSRKEAGMNSSEKSDKNPTTRRGSNHAASFQGESHLEKFFLDQLQDIYYAENKITQALPRMAEAATTDELKEAFEDHLHQTQRHVKRLEKVFETLGKSAGGKKCEAIEGIAREVDNIIEETEEGTLTRDAALIIAAQKVEHYEIATYGGLLQLAITMQLHDAADLLDKTLIEEEDTDARLTEIAESDINLKAEHEDNQNAWEQDATGSEEEEESETGEEEDEDVDEESPTVQ